MYIHVNIHVIILSIYSCVHTCTRSSWMALYMCHVCAASVSLSHTDNNMHIHIYRHTYPPTHSWSEHDSNSAQVQVAYLLLHPAPTCAI